MDPKSVLFVLESKILTLGSWLLTLYLDFRFKITGSNKKTYVWYSMRI